MSSEDKILKGIDSLLQPGEQALAAMVGRPHGWSQAIAGSMMIGSSKQQRANDSADAAGFALASPMALAITNHRLLSLSMGAQAGMGIGGGVKELVGEAPLSDVDDVKVKRKLLGGQVEITLRGEKFSIDYGAGANAKGIAEAYASNR
jgi:hypothetical protein